MDPATSTQSTEEIGEEISPVRSKMATLASRSSFASFFLKNKKSLTKLKSDPSTTKDDPIGRVKVDPTAMNCAQVTCEEKEPAKEESSHLSSCEEQVNFEKDPLILNEDTVPVEGKTIVPVTPMIIQDSSDDVTIISSIASRKRSNEAIVISDTEPVTVIDSDIEIILPRRSQRSKPNAKPPADIECISISSDEGDRSKVADLRRSNRIGGTTPSQPVTPVIPLSDYSNMKKLNFTKPPTRPAENIDLSESCAKNLPASPTTVKPLTIILKPPKSPEQAQIINFNTSINLNSLNTTNPTNNSIVHVSVEGKKRGRRSSKAAAPTIFTVTSTTPVNVNPAQIIVASQAPAPIDNKVVTPQVTVTNAPVINSAPAVPVKPVTVPAVTTVAQVPARPAPVSATPASSVPAQVVRVPANLSSAPITQAPVNQVPVKTTVPPVTQVPVKTVAPSSQVPAPHKPSVPVNQVPVKPVVSTYVPFNRNTTLSTSPVKPKSSYMPKNFNDLDPSLREEMMARLSQRENNSSAGNCSSSDTSAITNNSAVDKFVIFHIIQRLVPGTFDASKSATGKLLPAPAFSVVYKTTDTFAALKRKLAESIRVSPFDLVLTLDSGQSEIFDTSRPSTLNIAGKTMEEYDRLNVNIRPKTEPAKKSSKQNNNTNIHGTTNGTSHGTTSGTANGTMLPPAPSNIASGKYLTNGTLQPPAQPPTQAQPQPLNAYPPSLVHRLYLYTKSSFSLYKSLLQTKKKQMYDSLTFLQTADQEMSKLSQDPVNQADQELWDAMDIKMSQSQAAASLLTINIKTAASRNQSHPIKISPTATIAQLLQSFAAEYKITGTKVVFDGDVLKDTETIGTILEDDDMVEIK